MAKKQTLMDRYKKAKQSTMFDNLGNVYVHALKSSYNPLITPAEAKQKTLVEYRRAANKFKRKAAKNFGVDPDRALDIVEQATVLMDNLILDPNLLQGKTENPSGFQPLKTGLGTDYKGKSIEISEKSFQAIASSITNAKNFRSADYSEPILQNVNSLAEYIDKIEEVIEDYGNLSQGALAELVQNSDGNLDGIAQRVLKLPVSQPDKLSLIHGPAGTQKTSINNLIKGWEELVKFKGRTKSSKKDEAKEVMRQVPGWMKGIGGQGMEVMVAAGMQSAQFTASKEMEELCKAIGGKIIPSQSSSSGNADFDPDIKHYDLLSSKNTTRKGDIALTFEIGRETGNFVVELGMSLKQKKLKPGKSTSFDVHTGNYREFLIRTNNFRTALEYDLTNSLVHKGATGNSHYLALKSLLAAQGALDALTGVQTREDMAYLLVFSNKVVSMHEYITSMSKDHSNLTLAIKGDKELSGITRKAGYRRQDFENAYDRSRKLLNLLYLKEVNIKGKTPKL